MILRDNKKPKAKPMAMKNIKAIQITSNKIKKTKLNAPPPPRPPLPKPETRYQASATTSGLDISSPEIGLEKKRTIKALPDINDLGMNGPWFTQVFGPKWQQFSRIFAMTLLFLYLLFIFVYNMPSPQSP